MQVRRAMVDTSGRHGDGLVGVQLPASRPPLGSRAAERRSRTASGWGSWPDGAGMPDYQPQGTLLTKPAPVIAENGRGLPSAACDGRLAQCRVAVGGDVVGGVLEAELGRAADVLTRLTELGMTARAGSLTTKLAVVVRPRRPVVSCRHSARSAEADTNALGAGIMTIVHLMRRSRLPPWRCDGRLDGLPAAGR
jgi:hypothetical protein